MSIYGYCRISTKEQSIDRQKRNIKDYSKDVIIVEEVYTGTKVEGRTQFNNLLKKVKEGDTIIFDSVSRMSRNAEEGFNLYQELFENGINLVFLKEQHINTETYKKALEKNIALTGDIIDSILKGVNNYLMRLAEQQIIIAFNQAEKEVMDLRQRTSEGMKTAKANGKQIGQKEGAKLVVKKSFKAKEGILKYSKDFNGTLGDSEVIKLLDISRNTYYKYKAELKESKE